MNESKKRLVSVSGSPRPRGRGGRVALLLAFALGIAVGAGDWMAWLPTVTGDDGAAGPSSVRTDVKPDSYVIATRRQSYYQRDGAGGLVTRERLPVRAEGEYRFQRTIQPAKTAIVVMDPWIDMASDHLNQYFGKITESRVVPLVRKALDRGHPVIIFTNDPAKVDYNTRIHPQLAKLIAEGRATLLYHHDLDDDAFADYLRGKGIDSLIYTGFASNMCVIGRRTGMIPMVQQGFRLFFVPQASAAVEYPETWEDQSIHRATTKVIAQWIADIVDYQEFIRDRP